MDAHGKKLFVQLDDDFPGVRANALDSLRDHLKKAGQSFRDILHEIDTAISAQKYAELETNYNQALQDNAAWVQRGQQQDQKIAQHEKTISDLRRKVAFYKGLRWTLRNWIWLGACALLPVVGWFAYPYAMAPAWPDAATAGLRSAAMTMRGGASSDKPFVSVIAGKPYWVLLRGETDIASYADKDGRALAMRCLHVFAVPAEPDSGAFLKADPYTWFGQLKWPERVVHCTPSPTQEAAR